MTTNESGRGKRHARAVDIRRTRIQNFTCRTKLNMFQMKKRQKSAVTLTGSVLSAAALTAITWIHAQTVAPQKRNLNETILKCGSRKRKRSTKKKSKKHLLREAIQKNRENILTVNLVGTVHTNRYLIHIVGNTADRRNFSQSSAEGSSPSIIHILSISLRFLKSLIVLSTSFVSLSR